MSEGLNSETSTTQKVKTLSVVIPTAAVLVLSAMLATPGLAAVPAYAGGDDKDDKKKDNDKVTICHFPPGNPDNAHTITIGKPALKAHLAHGDTIGPCDDKKKDDDKKY
jgi:hypothetical protein